MIENLVGRTIGKYRILERLGHGGMADVYRAYQASLDRDVALKVLHPYLMAGEEDFVGRFRREARDAAALRHPNIVQVFDFDHEDGLYYMVMECIDGRTLKERLKELRKRGRVMSLQEILHILAQIGDALDYAHQQGMLHRDIKPSNIMITGKGRAVLTDFGIARMMGGTRHTMTGSVTGTPAYMSPEQGRGADLDHRTDIYSLGIVLYEMVTGQVPFDADTPLAIMMRHVTDPLPSPRARRVDLPEAVETVIKRALYKRPEDRYQSARDMIKALKAAIEGHPLPEPKAPPAEVKPQPVRAGAAQAQMTRTVAPPKPLPPRERAVPAEGRGFLTMAALGVMSFLLVLACLVGGALFAIPYLLATPTPVQYVRPPILTPTWTFTPKATFTNTPTDTPSPTNTPTPTNTPLPTDTPLPPTDTPIPPTDTPLPPTNTPLPPTYTPTPVPTDTPTPAFGVSQLRANPNPINFGQCTTLEWEVDNVQAVYLVEGESQEGVGGHDSRQKCPSQTTTYILRVLYHDGTSKDFPLEVQVEASSGPSQEVKNAPGCNKARDELGVKKQAFCRYSPNGQEIAAPGNGTLWIVSYDGNSHRAVASSPPGYRIEENCLWSPDGQFLAFVLIIQGSGQRTIGMVGRDGSGMTVLEGMVADWPRWTEDRRLVFMNYGVGEQPFIWTPGGSYAPLTDRVNLSAGQVGQLYYPWRPGRSWAPGEGSYHE